jgi:cytochrome P450
MNKPIHDESQRSRASVIELLIAHSYESRGEAPTLEYLVDEAFTFIDAGVDTTGRTLAAAIYYVLGNPDILRKLREELDVSPISNPEGTEIYVKRLSSLTYLVQHRFSLSASGRYRRRLS